MPRLIPEDSSTAEYCLWWPWRVHENGASAPTQGTISTSQPAPSSFNGPGTDRVDLECRLLSGTDGGITAVDLLDGQTGRPCLPHPEHQHGPLPLDERTVWKLERSHIR